jgi:hypothetical protein
MMAVHDLATPFRGLHGFSSSLLQVLCSRPHRGSDRAGDEQTCHQ